ncbi:MAG: NAD(P)/FAD-dependent oxidoreductase [bacterium]|nr:NAD(P)/FAD-dependent oxidoreductase [bacterium]
MTDSAAIEVPVIVIGAGPAGLAVGACLKRAGVRSVLLERGENVGLTWRRHYDRLHLHTARQHSALPFIPFPPQTPRYASRQQVVDYLENYAARTALDIRFGQEVISATRTAGRWTVTTNDTTYESSYLVVAAGNIREPNIPHWPGQESFTGTVIHSSQYRNGSEYSGKSALVVGFGNSGGEIAIDLHDSGARTTMSVRNPVNVIPRELFGIPILSIGIAQQRTPARISDRLNAPILRRVVGDFTKHGLRKLPYGPATQIRKHHTIPLIDIGTIDLITSGAITVRPGIEAFTEEGVTFIDGTHDDVDLVVLATGYRPRVDTFIDARASYDENGTPLISGHEAGVPGLYYCGYYVSPTGMLREIGIEARRIAESIVTTAPSRPA